MLINNRIYNIDTNSRHWAISFSLNCNLVCNNDIYSFCRTVFVINVFQTKVCPHSIYYLFFLFWLVL